MCRPARETPRAPPLPWEGCSPGGESVLTRVLVAFDDEHRAYREVIAAGIRTLRPRTEVATTTPAEMEGEIGRFGPRVVVCMAPSPQDAGEGPAWVELDLRPGRAARVRVGSRRRELRDPTLGDLLRVVDEAEELAGKKAGSAGARGSEGFIRPTA